MQRTNRYGILGELGQADTWPGPKHLHDRLAKCGLNPGPKRFTQEGQASAKDDHGRV